MYKPPCHWVRCRGEHIPHNAVPGGMDLQGEDTFVGRAVHDGDVIPGKVVPSRGACYVAYGACEHCYQDYQMLVSDGASLKWLAASDGSLPSGAIQGGTTSEGEPLYIGRAHHNGMLIVGKVQLSHKCIYIPLGGQEYKHTNYEVLVCNTLNL
ncbi:uncharacterized protein LOC119462336 [Dermacentor silvarum]|uniref:uncharacterized protein LOC119462336 n=1 Tax=Dermacentor silvarum TaxID=543639 RepID=UPI001898E17B|nr:uncharacterized protein LOC119462336 [Dermacentor silvarum]